MNTSRIADVEKFYQLMEKLEDTLGGPRNLFECSGRMSWPNRGVYFFQEAGEYNRDVGERARIVRVGTHALKSGSRTSLWRRLAQHKGVNRTRGGNHRGSIFRLIVGAALMERDGLSYPTWGKGSSAARDITEAELSMEKNVSSVVGDMPFLWLSIEDEAGPESLRGTIERNSIALLSNFEKTPVNPPSENWLGHFSNRERVRKSGLWNSNHVGEDYDPSFLTVLEHQIDEMGKKT